MTAADVVVRDGLVLGMPENEYHGGPELSSSGMKTILERSPAHYAWEREHPVHKTVYDFGTAAHELVLGTGPGVVIVDAPDWRTKAAQEQRKAAQADGTPALLRREYDVARAMADKVLTHPDARAIFEAPESDTEVSAFWTDDETGVRLRARFDWLHRLRPVIADYKTAENADPRRFHRKAADLGYDVAAAVYRRGLTTVRGDDDAPLFWHVVQEKTPPYAVAVVELDADFLRVGAERARQAIGLYAACTAANEWPAYPTGIHPIHPPAWHRPGDTDPEEYLS